MTGYGPEELIGRRVDAVYQQSQWSFIRQPGSYEL
jgi:hypothetical protein